MFSRKWYLCNSKLKAIVHVNYQNLMLLRDLKLKRRSWKKEIEKDTVHSLTPFFSMKIRILLSASIALILAISSIPLLDHKCNHKLLLLSLFQFFSVTDTNQFFVVYADFLTRRASLSPVADLILRNGVIYTSDDSLLFADSMAVGNGRVLRVGNYSFVKVSWAWLAYLLNKRKKLFCLKKVVFYACGLQLVVCRSSQIIELESWILGERSWFLDLSILMCISYLVDCRFSRILL